MIITKYVHTTRPTRIIIRVYVRDIAEREKQITLAENKPPSSAGGETWDVFAQVFCP